MRRRPHVALLLLSLVPTVVACTDGVGGFSATGPGGVSNSGSGAAFAGGSARALTGGTGGAVIGGIGGWGEAASGGPASSGAGGQGGLGPTSGQAGSRDGTDGAAGSGGVNPPYGYGYIPTTVTPLDALAAYNAWKAVHLEECGSGKYRVRWENTRLDATVSEGIGYGMLLAVSHNERAVFDGLFAYYKSALNERGLMHWLRYGCDAHREIKYGLESPDNAAADADLDVAMALLMAKCRWGDANYGSEATPIINAIRTHMFMSDGSLIVLQPGDSEWYDELGNGCVNYSYFSPAYYRAFAEHDSAHASFWNDAADDAYTLLHRASHSNTGLVRNWGSSTGGDATNITYNRPSSYGDDAARTPWRIGTDYLWYGDAQAATWTNRVTTWVKSKGIKNTIQWYQLDGNPDEQANGWFDHTVINVGPFAVGAMSYDQATVNEFAAEILAIPAGVNDHDGEYFPRMLKALSLLTLTGGFTRCGGL